MDDALITPLHYHLTEVSLGLAFKLLVELIVDERPFADFEQTKVEESSKS